MIFITKWTYPVDVIIPRIIMKVPQLSQSGTAFLTISKEFETCLYDQGLRHKETPNGI